MIVGWHYAFWGVIVLGLVSAAWLSDLSTTQRWLAAGVFGLLGGAYAILRPHRETRDTARSIGYLAAAIVVTGVACAIHPALSLLLFIVYPQAWIFTSSLRRGIVATSALTVSATLGFVVSVGASGDTLASIVPQMLVSLGFSILLGWWVSRIIDQSRDRAELIQQLQTARAELAAANHAQGVVAERERMAREIHDTLAQGFTSILMLAQAATAEADRQDVPDGRGRADRQDGADSRDAATRHQVARRLAAIEDVARENLAEARALVAAFTPVDLAGARLPDAVLRLAARFAEQTGLAVTVEVDEAVAAVQRDHEVVLLRAVQEALTNVRRHAMASEVTVRLAADDGGARVEVSDDGIGFTATSPSIGFGLAGMRGRVGEAGGMIDVESRPGAGTRVVVRLPVHAPSVHGMPVGRPVAEGAS